MNAMSTVGIIEEQSMSFSLPSLPKNVTVTTDVSTEEFLWLCVFFFSLGTFVYASLKRKT